MPFLAHTGRKFDRFPDATTSPSRTLKTETSLFCPVLAKPSVKFTVYKKSRGDHGTHRFSPKLHIRQMLMLPERTPQFTVMRAAASTTIDG
jgi:hypothetical protein